MGHKATFNWLVENAKGPKETLLKKSMEFLNSEAT